MKSWLLVSSFIALAYAAQSQNLISNPYFLKGATCPGVAPGWERSSWGSQALTIDTNCSCNNGIVPGCIGVNSVPYPKFYSALMGITTLLSQFGVTRSFLGTAFSMPLNGGETYMVEYWYHPWARNNYHIDRIGAVVTNDTVFQNNYMNYLPTVEQILPITDTTQWLHFKESFIALGGEQLIWIGNVRPVSMVTQIPNYPNAPVQFNNGRSPMVFIDGVFVYKATDTVYSISLPNDTLLCPNQTLAIYPQRHGFLLEDTLTTYLWSTGSTDSSIVVNSPGTYWVQTSINQRFVAADTIVVDYYPANYRLNLPDTVTFCEGQMANIQATPDSMQLTAYLWSTGSTLTGIQTGLPGLYWLQAQTPCYSLSDSTWAVQDFCESYLWVPNAFTPDGDGINDFFEFKGAPEPVTLHIFDRWGKRVFFSENYQNNWDGTYQGQALPAGVYTYLIEYLYINPNGQQQNPAGSKRQVRGTVSLLL